MISDFLAVVGAEKALEKYSELLARRDESNHQNRASNCYAGNLDKTVKASSKQILAIETLQEKSEYAELPDELKTLSEARLRFPTMSLQELADYLKISKSCLSHRMRKLLSIAEKYTEK